MRAPSIAGNPGVLEHLRARARNLPLYLAAEAAGAEFAAQVANETEEVREWLVSEGGMAMTRPDKADFITAAQTVQAAVAEERGPEFAALLEAIQAAAITPQPPAWPPEAPRIPARVPQPPPPEPSALPC